jgi:hypothetical protein
VLVLVVLVLVLVVPPLSLMMPKMVLPRCLHRALPPHRPPTAPQRLRSP